MLNEVWTGLRRTSTPASPSGGTLAGVHQPAALGGDGRADPHGGAGRSPDLLGRAIRSGGAVSNWAQATALGLESAPLEEALFDPDSRYVARSLYMTQAPSLPRPVSAGADPRRRHDDLRTDRLWMSLHISLARRRSCLRRPGLRPGVGGDERQAPPIQARPTTITTPRAPPGASQGPLVDRAVRIPPAEGRDAPAAGVGGDARAADRSPPARGG